MKTLFVIVLVCASMCTYGGINTHDAAAPPHKFFRSMKAGKYKKIKIYGYDRARTVKRIQYRRGYDYYKYANRPSYLRMMGKAINGDKYYR
jgi:hypothetical protein